MPVYPWVPGDWDKLPRQPKPVDTLRLPDAADEGWPMTGAGGMETLMLLARETPLPANFKLRDLLGELPRQSMQSNRSIAWFADGKLVLKQQDQTRGPNFFDPQQIDDPVLRTQRLLQQRLRGTLRPSAPEFCPRRQLERLAGKGWTIYRFTTTYADSV